MKNNGIDKFDLVLDNLGEQELESWMPQELGYIGGYIFDSEWGDHVAMSIMIKPKKIITEQLFWQGEMSKKIYVLIAEFDDSGHTIRTVLFSDDNPHMSSISELDKNSNLNLINTPMAINASDGPPRKLPSVLELVEKSSRANMILISNPENLIALYGNEYKNKSKPLPMILGDTTYYWSERFEQEYENHLDQIEFTKNMSEEGSTNVDEVWWGFWALAFLVNS